MPSIGSMASGEHWVALKPCSRFVSAVQDTRVHGNRLPETTAGIAEIQPVVDPAADEGAIRKFGPIAKADDARIGRPNVQRAIGIAAKRQIRF